MSKNNIFSLLLLCLLLSIFFLSSLPNVHAVRITPDSVVIDFEPNKIERHTFKVSGANKIEVIKEGALAEYVELEKTVLNDGEPFTVTIRLPEKIEKPGDNLAFISAMELKETRGMVEGIAVIRTAIVVRVPYPGLYADLGLHIKDVAVNETIPIRVVVNNLGTVPIKKVTATFDIFNSENQLIAVLQAENDLIDIKTIEYLDVQFNTTDLEPGGYKVIAKITYDGKSQELSDTFDVGVQSVDLIDHTNEFAKDKIGKFEVNVESKWDTRIPDLHAEIVIHTYKGIVAKLKTSTEELNPRERKTLFTYWDTTGLAPGEYQALITLYFSGKSIQIDRGVKIIDPEETARIAYFSNTKTQQYDLLSYLNPTTILIGAITILVIINIFLFIRKKNKSELAKQQLSTTGDNQANKFDSKLKKKSK